MKKLLHIVHVEDCPEDSELVQNTLQADGLNCEFLRVETRDELAKALDQSHWDLILSDCTLPHFHGLEALELAHKSRPDTPFIFVSGTIGEETAIKSLQNGATDYVLKNRLSRLVPAVHRALTDAEAKIVRRSMEAQLRQARKLEAIGTSVGSLAHDFRNLLQILTMSIDMLMLKSTDPEITHIAERLANTTKRGSHMIEELLVFARKKDACLIPMDMAEPIRQFLLAIEASLPSNITLFVELQENLPEVLADSDQLDRILTNLIMNARDAMPDGGRITVSSDVVQFDRIPANSWQVKREPYFRLKVSDTGTGIDEAIQTRIFEPFFTTKPIGKGTGLGLSVVFGLMESHHGFIDIESKVGVGTTFSLFFPIADKDKTIPDAVHNISPRKLLGRIADSVRLPRITAPNRVKV